MRDLLPEETRERRELAARVLQRLELFGYELVLLPAFEFAEVLERGLGALEPSEVLRFVEPESGEVAALRPDLTPQIARMIATRLRNRHAPLRLCYEGTVLRRRSGAARKHRQITQVGIELAGGGAPSSSQHVEADLEVLVLAAEAISVSGLERFTIDLGDAGIVRALLDGASDNVVARVTGALAVRDEGELRACGLAVLADLVRLSSSR